MASKPVTMGAEHERHMMSREAATKFAVAFSSTSTPTAVANRVMRAVAFPLIQYGTARSGCEHGRTYLDVHDKVFGQPLILIPLFWNQADVVSCIAEGKALVPRCLWPGLRTSGAHKTRREPVDRVDEVLRRRPFRVSEVLRKRLNRFRRPPPDIVFDKGLNELIPPLHTFDIQSALLEHPQCLELPELREGWKAIKLSMIELSVQPLDLAVAPKARVFNFHLLTVAVDPREIRLYLGPKGLEVYRYNSASPPLGIVFR